MEEDLLPYGIRELKRRRLHKDVHAIYTRYNNGESTVRLASDYEVSLVTLLRVLNTHYGNTWISQIRCKKRKRMAVAKATELSLMV